MTTIMILAAIWLVIAPFVLTVSTAALWTSIIAAVVVAGLALLGTWGKARFWGVAAVGVYLVVSAFFFGGAALWSGLIAGIVLAIVGYMAATQAGAAERRPA
jgi:hypothetical protein